MSNLSVKQPDSNLSTVTNKKVSSTSYTDLIDVEDFGALGEEMEDEEDILSDADETMSEDMLGDEDGEDSHL